MDLEIYDWISLSSTQDSRKILRVPKWVYGGRLFVVSAHDGSIITRVFLLSLAVLVPNGYMAVGYLLFLHMMAALSHVFFFYLSRGYPMGIWR